MHCPTCYELQQGQKLPSPSAIHMPQNFNQSVGLDGVKWTGKSNKTFTFGHIYDEATGFNLGKQISTEGSEEMLRLYQDI